MRTSSLPFIIATAPLCALLIASCSEPTRPDPVEPPRVETVVAETLVVLSAIGESRDLAASVRRGPDPVASNVNWWSASDARVRVSLGGRATGRGVGRTMLYAVADSGGVDSIAVLVAPVVTGIGFVSVPPTIMQERVRTYVVVGFDSAGHSTGGAKVSFSVDDTAIVRVDSLGVVTARAVGTTTIRATKSTLEASVALTVTPLPALRFADDTIVLAEGTRRLHGIPLFADSAGTGAALVTATVEDPSIAWATPALRVPRLTDEDPHFVLHGLKIGTTRVRLSAPGWTDAEVVLVVAGRRLGEAGSHRARAVLGHATGFSPGPVDSMGRNFALLQSHVVRFASSDPGVAEVVSDSVTITGQETPATPLVTHTLGEASIVATADGFRPETLVLQVGSGSIYHDYGTNGPLQLALGHRGYVRLHSSIWTIMGGTELEVTLTQTDSSVSRLPDGRPRFWVADPTPLLWVEGLKIGVDTIIVGAPGHEPDTIPVAVTRAGIEIEDPPTAVAYTYFLTIRARIPETPARGVPTTFRLQSSAPAVIRAESEYVTIPAESRGLGFPMVLADSGRAVITISDTSGFYLPIVLDTIRVEPGTLNLHAPMEVGDNSFDLGVRQRRFIGVEAPSNYRSEVGGRLRSSDPTIVAISADTFVSLPLGFDIFSGVSPGSAWIVAEGVGFSPDSVLVTVKRGRVVLAGGGPTAQQAPYNETRVVVRDEDGHERITEDSIFVTLRSTDRNRLRLRDSLIVIPRGASGSDVVRFDAFRVGPVGVIVVPTRPLAPFVEPAATGYLIFDPLNPGAGGATVTRPP